LPILQNKPHKFPVKDVHLNFDTMSIPELHNSYIISFQRFWEKNCKIQS